MKKTTKSMIGFAVDSAVFGAGAGVMGASAAGLTGPAKTLANATTTMYAAKMFTHGAEQALGSEKRKRKK